MRTQSMRKVTKLALVLAVSLLPIACKPGGREEQIEIKQKPDPMVEVRSLLENYAKGQPMTSEVTSFPKLVEDLRAVDAGKADILEKGLDDLQKAKPNARPGKAKELLDKLK